MTARNAIVAFAALLLAAGPAAADKTPPPVDETVPPSLGFFNAGDPHCYQRSFDEAWLKAHPKQKITALAFIYEPAILFAGVVEPVPMWRYEEGVGTFTALFAVTLKDQYSIGGVEFLCVAGKDENELACTPVGDPGSIRLTLLSTGGDIGLANEGEGFDVFIRTDAEGEGTRIRIDPRDGEALFDLQPSGAGFCDAAHDEWYPSDAAPK